MAEHTALARLVKRARLARNLQQKTVAERAGISTGYYGWVERGTRRPRPEVLARIARVLDIDPLDASRAAGYAPAALGAQIVSAETIEQAAWLRQFAARFSAEELERLYEFALAWQPREPTAPEERVRRRA